MVAPAGLLAAHWRGRDDYHPVMVAQDRQWIDRDTGKSKIKPAGTYDKVKGPITAELFEKHLAGELTLGRYQIDESNHVYWMVADAEHESWALEEIEEGKKFLDQFFLKYVLEVSSPGRYHLWILMNAPLPAEAAFRFGLYYKAHIYEAFKHRIEWIASTDPEEQAEQRADEDRRMRNREFFPKQGNRGADGFGNLVRLPLGFHQKKKVWSTIPDLPATGVLPTNAPMTVMMALAQLEVARPDPLPSLRVKNPEINISDRPVRTGMKHSADFSARLEAVWRVLSIESLVAQTMGIQTPRPGDKVHCPFHAHIASSSQTPALMVGGRYATRSVMCWSASCRLQYKRLGHLNFFREYFSEPDPEVALLALERLAGLK